MKGKVFATVVMMVLVLAGLLASQKALAATDPSLEVDAVFSAINSGDVEIAAAAFAEDATIENKVRGETYHGLDEIRPVLEEMRREGRKYMVVKALAEGNTITATVEVSDLGHVWGTEIVEAVVKNGKLQTLTVKAFYLQLWRIGR